MIFDRIEPCHHSYYCASLWNGSFLADLLDLFICGIQTLKIQAVINDFDSFWTDASAYQRIFAGRAVGYRPICKARKQVLHPGIKRVPKPISVRPLAFLSVIIMTGVRHQIAGRILKNVAGVKKGWTISGFSRRIFWKILSKQRKSYFPILLTDTISSPEIPENLFPWTLRALRSGLPDGTVSCLFL